MGGWENFLDCLGCYFGNPQIVLELLGATKVRPPYFIELVGGTGSNWVLHIHIYIAGIYIHINDPVIPIL